MLLAIALSSALASDTIKVKCATPTGKIVRYPPKDCDGQFALYARDFDGKVSVDATAGSGGLGVTSTVTQLAMDEINKELRTHYVAACTMARTDPCGAGMDAFIRVNSEMPQVYTELREHLAQASSTADVEAISSAVRSAFSDEHDRDAALTERLERALDDKRAESDRDAATLLGTWLVAYETTNSSCVDTSFTKTWNVTDSAFPGAFDITFDASGGGTFAFRGVPRGDEVVLENAPGGLPMSWSAGLVRVDSAGRLVGTVQLYCDALFLPWTVDYKIAGQRP